MQVYHISVCFCLLSTTYCSPAFWPRSRSGGSVGSAGPQEEEVEEPQTLEPQQSGRRSSRETESNGGVWTGRKTEDTEKRAKGHHREEKIQIEHVAKERGEGRQQKACEQAKIAQKALLSNSIENFQSVFFCAAFFKLGRTGLHLISAWESTSSASVLKIKRKSCSVFNAVKEVQSTTQTQKHDSYSCKITLQEDRYGFSRNLQESH